MNEGTTFRRLELVVQSKVLQFEAVEDPPSILDRIFREGARKMLQAALEEEVNSFMELHSSKIDDEGRTQVICKGYMSSREVISGAGQLKIQQPRVRDKSPSNGDRVKFSSSILPPYLRRSKSIDELLPWRYLMGVSTGDFSDALPSITGGPVEGMSANTIVRLKDSWTKDFEQRN
jgi:transposase-like protein